MRVIATATLVATALSFQASAQEDDEVDGDEGSEESGDEAPATSSDGDFSNVRVHTGSDDDRRTRDLGARAYTNRGDVVLSDRDTNRSNARVLAHELAHTAQQAGGQRSETSSASDDEADEDGAARKDESGDREPRTRPRTGGRPHRPD